MFVCWSVGRLVLFRARRILAAMSTGNVRQFLTARRPSSTSSCPLGNNSIRARAAVLVLWTSWPSVHSLSIRFCKSHASSCLLFACRLKRYKREWLAGTVHALPDTEVGRSVGAGNMLANYESSSQLRLACLCVHSRLSLFRGSKRANN